MQGAEIVADEGKLSLRTIYSSLPHDRRRKGDKGGQVEPAVQGEGPSRVVKVGKVPEDKRLPDQGNGRP